MSAVKQAEDPVKCSYLLSEWNCVLKTCVAGTRITIVIILQGKVAEWSGRRT